MKIIEFEAIYGNASLSGYAIAEELDDDEEILHFYDREGFETGNPFPGKMSEDESELIQAINSDFMLPQFLADFQDEEATIDRKEYTLHINGGAKLKMRVEKKEYEEFNAAISFTFGDTILTDDNLELLGETLAAGWYTKRDDCYGFKRGANTIYIYIDEYDKERKTQIEEEMLADARCVFAQQLVHDKGVYYKYYDLLRDHYVKIQDERAYDSQFLSDCANNYEQRMETDSIEELNNLCFKEMISDMIYDIEGDVCNA